MSLPWLPTREPSIMAAQSLGICTVLLCVVNAAVATMGGAIARPPPPPPITPPLQFSTGFSNYTILQRGDVGVSVYGFVAASTSVTVRVMGVAGDGTKVSYSVAATVAPWQDTTGCNATRCPYPSTNPMPAHGAFTWKATLQPQPSAGGTFTITVSTAGEATTIVMGEVTYGDVYFCSGQSNMALEMYFTFSVDAIKADMAAGKYDGLRTFEFGYMNGRFESPNPQWVTTYDADNTWQPVTNSSRLPSGPPGGYSAHSLWARFSATCMYFGAELMDARAALGMESVPIGLIQSSVGGTQIESWMPNASITECTDLEDNAGLSQLYHAMVAPFTNFSVAGWLWYQGENNCHGVMGNVLQKRGYGCAMPALVRGWREVWSRAMSGPDERLFGIATLAAGGSEGTGQHMAGMRWSQTANYGRWDNPALPNTFGAQAYDLGDPWASAGDGNKRVMNTTACNAGTCKPAINEQGKEMLDCCWYGMPWSNCTGSKPCTDGYNCSLPEPETGKYGSTCKVWNDTDFLPLMRPVASGVRLNSPSGTPGNNFMGSIHPRIKRPVGRRLAYAAAMMLKRQEHRRAGLPEDVESGGALTGPTIAGCTYASGKLELMFNATLLGGEGLLLRPFDANETGGWSANPFNDSSASYHPYPEVPPLLPTIDSLGAMVCVADESIGGNASTCQCQSWEYLPHNNSQGQLETFWYCEDGPGWKPPPAEAASERQRRRLERDALADDDVALATTSSSSSRPTASAMTPVSRWGGGRFSATFNPYQSQWKPVALLAGPASSSVIVDLSSAALQGKVPLAVRLAWPLAGGVRGVDADTCCPTRAIQDGHGICMPGGCPLYSAVSELPANPFFAAIVGGKCQCEAPQVCDA